MAGLTRHGASTVGQACALRLRLRSVPAAASTIPRTRTWLRLNPRPNGARPAIALTMDSATGICSFLACTWLDLPSRECIQAPDQIRPGMIQPMVLTSCPPQPSLIRSLETPRTAGFPSQSVLPFRRCEAGGQTCCSLSSAVQALSADHATRSCLASLRASVRGIASCRPALAGDRANILSGASAQAH